MVNNTSKETLLEKIFLTTIKEKPYQLNDNQKQKFLLYSELLQKVSFRKDWIKSHIINYGEDLKTYIKIHSF